MSSRDINASATIAHRPSGDTVQIHRPDSSSPTPAPEPTFTGDVRIDDYFRREAPSRLAGATVSFAPGARTPWKTNPFGQTVIVTDGRGRARAEHGDVVEIGVGDVLWFPAGEAHWEGAAPDCALSYVALQEEDHETVRFLAAVTDDQYAALD